MNILSKLNKMMLNFTSSILEQINLLRDLLSEHEKSNAHDDRYYRKSEVNNHLNLKSDISDIVNNLSSTATNRPLSANQGRMLKQFIDDINVILNSDDTTLDELQEIVDFIKANREDLDSLSISNIGGLSNALNSKVDKVSGKELSTNDFTNNLKSKLDGVESGAQVNPDTTASRTDNSAVRVLQARSMNQHRTSGDHDDRYYRKNEVDSRITEATSNLDEGVGHALEQHKSSGDHDDRYVLQSGYTAFNPSGNYSGLRAGATTKDDVDLGNVRNVDSYSRSESDDRYYQQGEVDSRISGAEGRANQLTDLRHQQALDSIIITTPAIVANEEQAASLRGENESFQEVFDNWIRFSHLASQRPFSESHLNGWEYDPETDRIISQLNSPSTVGFVSLDRYENYVFDVIVDSTNSDDDLIGIVLAYAEDAQGRGNAIYAFRTPGGIGHNSEDFISNRRWLFHVGLNISDGTGDMPAIDLGSNNRGLIWGDTGQVNDDRGRRGDVGQWNTYGRVRIRAERNGDHFKVETSNPDSMDLVPEATVEFSLTDHPELSLFRGGAAIGYTQHSQQDSFFETLQRPSSQSSIVDVENQLLWENDGNVWSSSDLNESDAIIPRRFYLNTETNQLFFSNVEGNLTEVPNFDTLSTLLSSQSILYVSAVREERTINAGQSVTYDLQSIVGSLVDYDTDASDIRVKIRDTQSGSPTENMLVNSESMIVTAIDNSRTVNIVNVSDVNLHCNILVYIPRKR